MINIKVNNLNFNKAYMLIKENFIKCSTKSRAIPDAMYYHNIALKNLHNAIENGILSLSDQARLEGKQLSPEEVARLNGEGHVNGHENISLSSMNLDFSTMYRDEEYFDHKATIEADIAISSKVKANRDTTNYFNEFLVSNKISTDLFRGIDIRILKLLKYNFLDEEKNSLESRLEMIVNYCNYLKIAATSLVQSGLDIPLREVSDEIITLDPEKVMKLPELKLTK